MLVCGRDRLGVAHPEEITILILNVERDDDSQSTALSVD